jgi:hypothetical protein
VDLQFTSSQAPGPVQPTATRAPRGTELVRLRLPDRPGSLAAAAAHLASFSVDVLRLEVVDRDEQTAVDDFLLSGPMLGAALAELGPRATVLARRPGVDLRDPALAMADACEAVASARSEEDTYARLVAAALGLVFAEAGLACIRRDGGILAVAASTVPGLPIAIDASGASLIDSALASGECLTADGRIPWAPGVLRDALPPGSVAVVPSPSRGRSDDAFVLVLLREDHAPFAGAELERLAALVRVACHALRLNSAGRA